MTPRLADALAELAEALLAEVRAAPPSQPPALMSVQQVAQALGVSRTALYGVLRGGELRSVRVGRRRLVTQADLEAYVAQDHG